MISGVDEWHGPVPPETEGVATVLAAVADARFWAGFPGSGVEGLVDETGFFRFFHNLQSFCPGNFLGKSLGNRMPCGFAECKAIQGGGAGGTIIPQKTSPLPAETVSYGNFVKLVDDVFNSSEKPLVCLSCSMVCEEASLNAQIRSSSFSSFTTRPIMVMAVSLSGKGNMPCLQITPVAFFSLSYGIRSIIVYTPFRYEKVIFHTHYCIYVAD